MKFPIKNQFCYFGPGRDQVGVFWRMQGNLFQDIHGVEHSLCSPLFYKNGEVALLEDLATESELG